MAARKTGLGRGIDGLFPSYNQSETDSAKKSSGSKNEQTAGSSGDKKKTGKTEKSSAGGKGKASQSKDSTAEKSTSKSAAKSSAKSAAASEERSKPQDTAELSLQSEAGSSKDGVVTMKISAVEPNRDQPRKYFNEDSLQELSESIRQYGIIQPLLVQKRDDYFEIIAGERRWRAAKMAGVKEVPVIVRDYSDQEIVEISLIENIQREDLNPIEEAKAYQRLLEEFSLKQDEVAERVSKSRSTITNAIRLLRLDERVQQMLIDENISAGHARALLAIEDPQQQYEIAQQVFDEHLSVRDVEKLVKKIQKGAQAPKPDPEALQHASAMNLICQSMEDRMKEVLGTKVVVHRRSDKRGRIEIEYYSTEELERLYDLIRSIDNKAESDEDE